MEIYSLDSFAHRDARRWAYVRLPSSLPAVYPNGYQPAETIGENDFSALRWACAAITCWAGTGT